MKKLLTIVLAMLMLLSLSGCSGGTKKFDKWVPKGISFYMTLEEVEDVLGKHYETTLDLTTIKIIKYYNGDEYRFTDYTLGSFALQDRTSLAELMNKYGEPTKVNDNFNIWYGTLNGTDCWMRYDTYTDELSFGIGD